MKLSEVARYWAARELTRIERTGNTWTFHAPFACPLFTVRIATEREPARVLADADRPTLRRVDGALQLVEGTWCRQGTEVLVCRDLPKRTSSITLD